MDIKTEYRLPPAITVGDVKVPAQTVGNKVPLNEKTTALQAATKPENDVAPLDTAVKDAKAERDTLETAVSNLQDFTQNIQRNLNFSINESTGRTVVEVTDRVSGEVIRQLPTEEALRLAESLDEMRSLLFTAQA
ncbi:MAG: flagellar protein FlaG [Pseudomonas sp.]|nr:flagellar protein FlaG [Pseudomonas sp.]